VFIRAPWNVFGIIVILNVTERYKLVDYREIICFGTL
jgi:hypothetical protein